MPITGTVPDVSLNNGVLMPILGFGVYQMPPGQTEQAATDALAYGYRHLDTAAAYGNEETVGRQPLDDYYSQWRATQDLHRQGVTRAIGVSNFCPDRLIDLIEHNEVTPAVNQVETNPYFQRHDDQALMRERGVQLESWGPFAKGRNDLFTDPTLSAIGAAHGKSAAQVVLRWLLQRHVVVIPKSVRPERMAENIDVFDFALSEDDMAAIAAMDTGRSLFFDHRDPASVSRLNSFRVENP